MSINAINENSSNQVNNSEYKEKLNKLRAAVLGANDGIVSTAAVVIGVAGATTSMTAIALSAIASTIGGAVSMALGEYVSVYSQKDSELVNGHLEEDTVNPISAAIASFIAFFLGSLLPASAALFAPSSIKVIAIFLTTLVALAITGSLSAYVSRTNIFRSVMRLVIGGTLALLITYFAGVATGSLIS